MEKGENINGNCEPNRAISTPAPTNKFN
jgi:hypothetical protein